MRVKRTSATHFASAVPQFTVPDVVRTSEYYRDVLGFEIAGYWDAERVHQNPVVSDCNGLILAFGEDTRGRAT